MIGRADIEGSKSNVAMNAWLPQASYPCGNFSDTSTCKFRKRKGSIGHVFTVYSLTAQRNRTRVAPFGLHEISLPGECALGHLCYCLTDVPPQPNSPPTHILCSNHLESALGQPRKPKRLGNYRNRISESTLRIVVFQERVSSHLFYAPYVNPRG